MRLRYGLYRVAYRALIPNLLHPAFGNAIGLLHPALAVAALHVRSPLGGRGLRCLQTTPLKTLSVTAFKRLKQFSQILEKHNRLCRCLLGCPICSALGIIRVVV